jgi:hypothetical protein
MRRQHEKDFIMPLMSETATMDELYVNTIRTLAMDRFSRRAPDSFVRAIPISSSPAGRRE